MQFTIFITRSRYDIHFSIPINLQFIQILAKYSKVLIIMMNTQHPILNQLNNTILETDASNRLNHCPIKLGLTTHNI